MNDQRSWLRAAAGMAAATAVTLCGLGTGTRAVEVVQTPARFPEASLWLVPATDPVAGSNLAIGADLLASGRALQAQPYFSRELGQPTLGSYARLYIGRAQLALGQHADAVQSARHVIQTTPGGAIGVSALRLLASAHEAAGDWPAAVSAWQTVAGLRPSQGPEAHLRLAQAATRAGDEATARGAYSTLYFEHPASREAETAAGVLARLPKLATTPETGRLELARAEKLFAARRYSDARSAFSALRATAAADARAVIDLRMAQADFHLSRYTAARDGLRLILDRPGPKSVEAAFYWLGTLRGLRQGAEYVAAVANFVDAYPAHPRAEAALNDLATYYILADDDRRAAEVLTRQYALFPTGAFADRAAWKAGWWAYRTANYRETIRLFESAAVSMRRADYRPAWLYWAAKAHEALGEREAAAAGFRQTVVFYRNSYYGREADRALARLQPSRVVPASAGGPAGTSPLTIGPTAFPPQAALIQALIAAGLYDDAIAELQHAASVSGTSPVIEATIAYALNRKGELRPAITAMRRAYPQFMAEGGEELPARVLKVIFPIAYRPLLERYAADRDLDVFLVMALVAQESTFQADVRSAANAWGLMQLLPSTGRRVGASLGIRGITATRLTDPDINVRLGTAYLSSLLKQFRDEAKALAAYNAGEHRVVRWQTERPGLDRDEFVDDIPFPETQNYVKRIVGTTEDYRILYGGAPASAGRTAVR